MQNIVGQINRHSSSRGTNRQSTRHQNNPSTNSDQRQQTTGVKTPLDSLHLFLPPSASFRVEHCLFGLFATFITFFVEQQSRRQRFSSEPSSSSVQLRRVIQRVIFCFYKKGNILSIEKKERENVGYLKQMKPAVKSKVNRVQRGFYMSITATAESNSSIFLSKIALKPTQRKEAQST